MSTADVTHVQQGFRIPIPRVNEEARTEVPVLKLCERYLKHGTPFKRVCSNVQKARDWLRATVNSLTLIQETVIRQALESLPGDDDRQWVGVDKVYGEVGVGNEDSFSQRMDDRRDRSKREEPELRDVQYHIFGIAGAGDVDYNRQLIKVLQESSSDMSKDMYELANQTEEAMNMISTVTTHVAMMEEYMKKKHNWVVKLINYLEITDDAMQLFDFLMTMMLEDRMGAVVYLQDLVDQSYAFRKGIQSLLQGKLTIDLVPPALIKTAITEVTAYLKREHPRFTVAFESVAFYYDNTRIIIGSGKYTTTVRLLKYTSGLATPIPANLPRLVDSGWSMLGDETITRRNVSRMMRGGRARRPEAPPRPASMEDLTTNRVGTGAVYEPLH